RMESFAIAPAGRPTGTLLDHDGSTALGFAGEPARRGLDIPLAREGAALDLVQQQMVAGGEPDGHAPDGRLTPAVAGPARIQGDLETPRDQEIDQRLIGFQQPRAEEATQQ